MNPREEWHLDTHHLGRRVLVYDSVTSTNTVAAALAHDPSNDGLILLADTQTAGRGQHGRHWECPPALGVLMSALLLPPAQVRRPVVLAAWASVAVAETILETTGLQARIKWPNDVLIQGRKVCGILIEQGKSTVVGIGLNVNQSAQDLENAGLPNASSLALCLGKSLDRLDVFRRLVHHLDNQYERLIQGDFATLEALWKWGTGMLGMQVVLECHDANHEGRLRAIGFEELELEESGKTLRFRPESIRHIIELQSTLPNREEAPEA